MTGTNVPPVSFGATGFVAPSQTDILAGVQADFQAAFAGNLNFANPSTPQGQLATSMAAIIGDCYDQMVALYNGVDPAFASGRLQDAIGRIYFLPRIAATATIASCVCSGLTGTTIPVGALAVDQDGNLYAATQSGLIDASGSVTLTFACQTNGTIACPATFVNAIYQAIPGWDSIINPDAGVVGNDAETRAAYETRRQQSVALNAQGTAPSVLGAVYAVPGVLDAYVLENPSSATSGASIVGSLSGGTLTVTSVLNGTIAVGQMLTGTGPLGGTGGPVLGTTITGLGSGTGATGTYTIDINQSLASSALTAAVGGTRLSGHSIFVSVYGGSAGSIASAIWSKKSPGCDYNGNTSVVVADPSPQYGTTPPLYTVTYHTPPTVALGITIVMGLTAAVPANGVTLVKNAVLASFSGLADNARRARMGSVIYATQFIPAISALGDWAQTISIIIGRRTVATQAFVTCPITLEPVLDAADIGVTFQVS